MYALEIENLNYIYPDQTRALDNVSLKIRKKMKTAILGTNGSGKTTLIYHLNGIIPAQSGTVKVAGQAICKKTLFEVRRTVGLLFDSPDNQLFSTTVFGDIAFGPRNLQMAPEAVDEKVHGAMQKVDIAGLADRPPYCLSLGQKKRAAIAGILAMEPQILACDEPFSGLDPHVGRQFRELLDQLKENGVTLIYSTHDVDQAYAWADEVVLMKSARVIAAGPVDLLRDEALMEKACLPLPLLARLFRGGKEQPRTVEEAVSLNNLESRK